MEKHEQIGSVVSNLRQEAVEIKSGRLMAAFRGPGGSKNTKKRDCLPRNVVIVVKVRYFGCDLGTTRRGERLFLEHHVG